MYVMKCLQTNKHFRSSILSEITWPVLSIFFPCIRIWKELIRHLGESFVIFINIRFQKWLCFFLFFSKRATLRQSKTGLTVDHIFCLEGFWSTKSLENFNCRFIQNRYGKFYLHFAIAVKVHVLVSKIW